jgi:hypothetical protein
MHKMNMMISHPISKWRGTTGSKGMVQKTWGLLPCSSLNATSYRLQNQSTVIKTLSTTSRPRDPGNVLRAFEIINSKISLNHHGPFLLTNLENLLRRP